MNAQKVADFIKKLGFNVINVSQGDEEQDGMVEVTELVHIQVPTYGSGLNVVQECADGSFNFYPTHQAKGTCAPLIADLRKALGFEIAS